ncbi:hypothetical protein HG537_0E04480 [Torulaspora globosa]|uniref:Pumilio homology domain family member 3 n=1 Tax=Torulaspora globosa TaxID=48254 RepID=A0A7H9HV12_9SACH|nr:hypothetical protein HG537_0E04480 [Torulaspora sp. CBS 2947]
MDPWSVTDVGGGSRAGSPGTLDAELASIVSSLSALSNPHAAPQLGGFRRSSFTESDAPRRTAMSVGTAPGYGSGQRFKYVSNAGQYSASIGGPILSTQTPSVIDGGGGFFEKFGKTLIEGTRELEQGTDAAETEEDTTEFVPPSRNIWNVAQAPVFRPAEQTYAGPPLQGGFAVEPYAFVPNGDLYGAPKRGKGGKKPRANPYLEGRKKRAGKGSSPPPQRQQGGQSGPVRSPVLEEFRMNSGSKNYTLDDILGYVLEFCKDQHGSRFIQHELAGASASQREVVFNEIREHAIELSDDVFGNYVIQKFFEYGSSTQRDVLVSQFAGKMRKLSMQMYACRVIQKALEFIEPHQRIALANELSGCVLVMIKDQNGNHVIQKAIERIPMVKLPYILDSLGGQIYHLSTHSYGCRVVQRLLEFGSERDQSRILAELKEFIPYLVQDQYGNYVIQHILQQQDAESYPEMRATKQMIVDTVSENVVELSKHKFASNVVEKAVIYGSPTQKALIMSKILPHSESHARDLEDSAPIILMMRDQFANYVVQKLVGVSEGQDKRLIVTAIRAYLDKLNKSDSMGNRHLASVEKLASLVESVKL